MGYAAQRTSNTPGLAKRSALDHRFVGMLLPPAMSSINLPLGGSPLACVKYYEPETGT